MNRRFGSQINARIALDQIRREVHCASAVTPDRVGRRRSRSRSAVAVPTAGAGTTVSWCTAGSGTRYVLYRKVGATCDTAGKKTVDYLTTGTVFCFTPQSTTSLATLSVTLPGEHEAGERPSRLSARRRHRPPELDANVVRYLAGVGAGHSPRRVTLPCPDGAFTATGSPNRGAGVPDSPLSALRRVLGDERGLALPFALGVMVVLSRRSRPGSSRT